MVEKEEETQKKRITVGLDDFDHKVVNKMAINRKLSLSEVVRTIVHQWIEYNPDLLKKNYDIDFKEITDELRQESYEISLDKSLKSFEKEIIKELPEFFELVESISTEDLADHFDVDTRVIKRIMFIHGKEIKKQGLNLKLKNNVIYKEMD
ncbi:MAG: hypothetical protein EU539_00585 [Promethearchaeota archaeon]|nr:MAG: hypothetical protein EU539_00585 [Candidatus Lokiarchaeota archaeon]